MPNLQWRLHPVSPGLRRSHTRRWCTGCWRRPSPQWCPHPRPLWWRKHLGRESHTRRKAFEGRSGAALWPLRVQRWQTRPSESAPVNTEALLLTDAAKKRKPCSILSICCFLLFMVTIILCDCSCECGFFILYFINKQSIYISAWII